jgi:hypothetical protein
MIKRESIAAVVGAVALLLSACGGPGEVADVIYFPTHERGPDEPLPAGQLTGNLVIDDQAGCIWIQESQDLKYLVIWPPGYALQSVEGDWQVVDASGSVVGGNGDMVTIGGGEFKDPAVVTEFGAEEPPSTCRTGEYWVAAFDS